MVEDIALFAVGMFIWTFIEYLIHGWLSHTFHTFAMRLHAVHHHDPHAIFTVRAWMPIAVVYAILALVVHWTPLTILFSGAVAGFAGYEALHYRIHFWRPRGRVEDYLRSRHLVHHEYYPNRCFGVTSAFWDLAFATEPMGNEMASLCESVRSKPPLTGRTNLYKLKHYLLPFPLTKYLATSSRTQ
jgi:hypothetical protein